MSIQRKVVATEAFQSEDDVMVWKIQRHMCHSAQTCENFYQHTDNYTATSTKRAIQKLAIARYFTQQESSSIMKEYPLTEEQTPALGICQKIKEKYNLNKTKNKYKIIGGLPKNHN